jgi:hypothetical protein
VVFDRADREHAAHLAQIRNLPKVDGRLESHRAIGKLLRPRRRP